jgi:hypothetical protein
MSTFELQPSQLVELTPHMMSKPAWCIYSALAIVLAMHRHFAPDVDQGSSRNDFRYPELRVIAQGERAYRQQDVKVEIPAEFTEFSWQHGKSGRSGDLADGPHN